MRTMEEIQKDMEDEDFQEVRIFHTVLCGLDYYHAQNVGDRDCERNEDMLEHFDNFLSHGIFINAREYFNKSGCTLQSIKKVMALHQRNFPKFVGYFYHAAHHYDGCAGFIVLATAPYYSAIHDCGLMHQCGRSIMSAFGATIEEAAEKLLAEQRKRIDKVRKQTKLRKEKAGE